MSDTPTPKGSPLLRAGKRLQKENAELRLLVDAVRKDAETFRAAERKNLRERDAALRENAELRKALDGLLEHYTRLVNSGDAGSWNPEEEPVVIAARKALK